MGAIGSYATEWVLPSFSGYMEGSLPADLGQVEEMWIHLIGVGADPAAQTFVIEYLGSSNGEAPMHVVWGGTYQILLTNNRLLHVPLLSNVANPSLVAGDVYGVRITSDVENTFVLNLLGTRIKYRVKYPLQGKLGIIREEFYTCQVLDLM